MDNMGGDESIVGIASEQGHDGSDGTHYGERAESLVAFGADVRLVDFESLLVVGLIRVDARTNVL